MGVLSGGYLPEGSAKLRNFTARNPKPTETIQVFLMWLAARSPPPAPPLAIFKSFAAPLHTHPATSNKDQSIDVFF